MDQGLLSKHIGFVDDRLEVSQLIDAFEDLRKLQVINATVVQEDAIDEVMVKVLAGLSQASAMALAQRILLQHERLSADLLQNRQCQIQIRLALLEVLNSWILIVRHTLAFMFDLALGCPHHIMYLLGELFAHNADRRGLFLLDPTKDATNLLFFLFRE